MNKAIERIALTPKFPFTETGTAPLGETLSGSPRKPRLVQRLIAPLGRAIRIALEAVRVVDAWQSRPGAKPDARQLVMQIFAGKHMTPAVENAIDQWKDEDGSL